MVSNGRIIRGNTSDLVGLWNSRAQESASQFLLTARSRSRSPFAGSLSPSNHNQFRKTSAQETYSSRSRDQETEIPFRKTSAMVLMPRSSNEESPRQRATLAIDGTGSYGCFKPRKTSAMAALGTSASLPMKSSLKVRPPPDHDDDKKTQSAILTVVTSPSGSDTRRGSQLGRSKSVKCHRVKFGPEADHHPVEGVHSSEGKHDRGEINGGKNESPFEKFKKLDSENCQSGLMFSGRLQRQASLPSVNCLPATSTQSDQLQQKENKKPALGRSVMARSPSSTKELLLMWVQQRTNTYVNLNVTNFSSCWNDGLAFCALIHYYYPEAFDYSSLDPKNRRYNFTLAFKTAEDYAGICPLLDVEDMMMMMKPDWKCVFTYVQSFYRRFRNGRDPPPPAKTLILTSHDEDGDKNDD